MRLEAESGQSRSAAFHRRKGGSPRSPKDGTTSRVLSRRQRSYNQDHRRAAGIVSPGSPTAADRVYLVYSSTFVYFPSLMATNCLSEAPRPLPCQRQIRIVEDHLNLGAVLLDLTLANRAHVGLASCRRSQRF